MGWITLGRGEPIRFPFPAVAFDSDPAITPDVTQSVAGDFDGDGNTDIVSVRVSSQLGQLFLGRGDGTFNGQPTFTLPVNNASFGRKPPPLAASDIDGDGATDLIALSTDTNEVGLLLSNGDGTFAPEVLFAVGERPSQVTVGDVDADGYEDVMVINDSSSDLSLLFGNGIGSLLPETRIAPSGFVLLTGAALGRTNGDELVDIVLTGFVETGNLQIGVLPATSSRTFGEPILSSFVEGGANPIVARVDGDGVADYMTFNKLLLGNGDATFQSGQSIDTLSRVPVGADFDGDGNLDYAVVRSREVVSLTGLNTFYGLGDGTFEEGPEVIVYSFFEQEVLAVADADGDGRPDLISDNGVLLQGEDGFVPIGLYKNFWTTFVPAAAWWGGDVADLNGDGATDLLNSTSAELEVLYGVGDGSLADPTPLPLGANPRDALAVDFDGDGDADIVSSHEAPNVLSTALNNGDGTFAAPTTYTLIGPGRGIRLTDVDNDDLTDVIVANGESVSVLLGNGDGTFAAPQSFDATCGVAQLSPGDVDGDGNVDIVTHCGGTALHLGAGDGTFGSPTFVDVGVSPSRVQLADMDQNGTLDLVTMQTGSAGELAVSLGNGDGTFAPADRYTGYTPLDSMEVVDANGDGSLDVFFGGSTTMTFLLGNGDGTFLPRIFMPCQADASIEFGDLSGDGRPDLICRSSDGIAVIPQR